MERMKIDYSHYDNDFTAFFIVLTIASDLTQRNGTGINYLHYGKIITRRYKVNTFKTIILDNL